MKAYPKITPHLWFDKEAPEAASFYVSLFPGSGIINTTTMENTPSGDCDVVTFQLWGQRFMAISAGPHFKFNPSISLMVNFDPAQFSSSATPQKDAQQKLDEVWNKLSDGGKVLMPLDKYPFSERYGWIEDKYGLSWQLILTNPAGEPRPPIIPSLMFTGEKCGKAEDAINFYLSVFEDSEQGAIHRYGKDQQPDQEGTVMFADFRIGDTWFAAMDSAHRHEFDFNEAISLLVNCESQAEIDDYWHKLSSDPLAEQCGWLKDQYGLSWQISPAAMEYMMRNGTREQINRVTQAFLPMKKLDIATIQKAYDNR